jgi:hypothetical protein
MFPAPFCVVSLEHNTPRIIRQLQLLQHLGCCGQQQEEQQQKGSSRQSTTQRVNGVVARQVW